MMAFDPDRILLSSIKSFFLPSRWLRTLLSEVSPDDSVKREPSDERRLLVRQLFKLLSEFLVSVFAFLSIYFVGLGLRLLATKLGKDAVPALLPILLSWSERALSIGALLLLVLFLVNATVATYKRF